jgi:hypothetical protein
VGSLFVARDSLPTAFSMDRRRAPPKFKNKQYAIESRGKDPPIEALLLDGLEGCVILIAPYEAASLPRIGLPRCGDL